MKLTADSFDNSGKHFAFEDFLLLLLLLSPQVNEEPGSESLTLGL